MMHTANTANTANQFQAEVAAFDAEAVAAKLIACLTAAVAEPGEFNYRFRQHDMVSDLCGSFTPTPDHRNWSRQECDQVHYMHQVLLAHVLHRWSVAMK